MKSPKNTSQTKYLEQVFLSDFPYTLAESFELASIDSRKLNVNKKHSTKTFYEKFWPTNYKIKKKMNANTINLLLSKFCSTSLLELDQEKMFSLFEYILNVIKSNSRTNESQGNHNVSISSNELRIVLNVAKLIFKTFSRAGKRNS